jgi:3-dehydrocarnitine:acetyl-CoA trimethylamine transferase
MSSDEVFITCAVTGAGDTTSRSSLVPVTPEQIADAAIEAASAGAAVVHIHVRDPETGKGSRDCLLYRDVVERIRASDVDVVLNLSGGMGGDLALGGAERPLPFTGDTDLVGASARLEHIVELRPEICTLDMGTLNYRPGGGDFVMVNTPAVLRKMASVVADLGIKPELEVFDSGDLVLVKELLADGAVEQPPLVQLCMGIPYGAPDDPATLVGLVAQLPRQAIFSAFALGRMQLPYVALAAITGGNARVGLEDNLYLSHGVLASNGDLVERARFILDSMNMKVIGPDAAREKLGLERHD